MKPITERHKRVRRLRKKLKVDEFIELGFDVNFSINATVNDEFIDKFLDDIVTFVEASNLSCFGFLSSKKQEPTEYLCHYMICSVKRYGKATEQDIQNAKAFFENYGSIENLVVSQLKDFNL